MSDLSIQVWERVSALTGRDLDELDSSLTLQGDLGFDSLKIMSLWQAVFGLLPAGVSGDLNDFASVQTLGDLVDTLETLSRKEGVADTRAPMVSETDPGGTRLPMAHAQQFFLLSHHLVQSTSLCASIEVAGKVDRTRLQAAWQALIARHINLRTCFFVPADATRLTQTEYRLLPDCMAPMPRSISANGAVQSWEEVFHDQLNRRWDLRQWPLHEVMVAELANGREAILLANEHIISDGLGTQRLLADLVALYDNPQAALPPVLDGAEYIAAIEAMNAYQSDEDEAEYKEREDGLRGIQSLWDPQGKVGADTGPVIFRNTRFAFSRDVTAGLQALAARVGTSVYALLLASLNARFRDRLALAADAPLMLQVPTGGKVFPGIELHETVSCFAQNLSICSRGPSTDLIDDARALGRDLRDALIGGQDRTQSRLMALAMAADFPMTEGLVPTFILDQARKSLRSNLYAPYIGESPLPARMAGLALGEYRSATKNVAGTIDVLHEVFDGQLIAFFNYDAACFSKADIDAFLADHVAAVSALIQPETATTSLSALRAQCAVILRRGAALLDPQADLQGALGLDSLGKIRLVNAVVPGQGGRKLARALVDCTTLAQMAALLDAGAALPAAVLAGPSPQAMQMRQDLPEIPLRHIEAQAKATPDAEAVTDGITSLTYAELDRAANQLAHTLCEAGVGKGDTVAVTCPRGPGMLTALLGILKLGAAYVPLDPAFPADRMSYIAEHARARVWVGDLGQIAGLFRGRDLPGCITRFIGLDDLGGDLGAVAQTPRAQWSANTAQPVATLHPDDLMVLLYTSGSTGQPKGVACHHRGYMNRLDWHQEQFQLREGERVALKTSFSFDVSVWELFWPLMVGGTIVAASRDLVSNPWALADWLAEQRIAILHFVPSLFNEFVNSNCAERLTLPDLRWLVFSGEALGVMPVRKWMTSQSNHIQLANLYGPTEASIDVTCDIIDQVPAEDQTRMSIGRAIRNTEMLILDDAGQPITQPGQQGELCIAGVQVASGYHRDIVKTASSFVYNTLAKQGVPGTIIYRTGDLAMWQKDGRIDYLGRKDSQIKLRGFRIELGEIEAVIASFPGVLEAAAVLRKGDGAGQDQLVVAYAPADIPAQDLRAHAARRLAEYAVPDVFLGFDSLPKNQNGKLDRKALNLDGAQGGMQQDKVVSLPARVAAVSAAPASGPAPVSARTPGTYLPVAPPQRALLQELAPGHCGASLLMLDYEASLDVARFTDAIRKVIDAHSALRSVFEKQGPNWMRVELDEVPPFLPDLHDATMLTEDAFREEFALVAQEAANTLRPDKWPLISVQVAKRGPDRCSIAILGSTLIGDMVGAFAFGRAIWQHYLDTDAKIPVVGVKDSQDLVSLYAAKAGDPAPLRDWWHNHLGAVPDGTTLPLDMPCGDATQGSSQEVEIVFDQSQTLAITDAASQAGGIGLYDVIAASVYRHLGAATGTDRVTVAHRVNGRNVLAERIYFDSIDCFAYNVPLCLTLNPAEDVAATARRLKAVQDSAPFKGYSYDAIGPDLSARHWPAPRTTEVRLNFLGEARTPQNSAVRFVPGASSGRVAPPHGQRSFALDCVAQLRQGQLAITAHFSGNQYRPETIQDFLQNLRTDLAAFVAAAQKKEMTHAA